MATQNKQDCKYGSKCYRKNKQHLKDFSHPGEDDDDKSDESPDKLNEKPAVRKRQNTCNKKGQQTISKYFAGSDHNSSNSDEDIKEEPEAKKLKEDSKPTDDDPASTDEIEKEEETEESTNAPDSPLDVKENIKAKYLVEMPEDFYHFWEFCKSLNPTKPQDALLSSLNLRLVGPFDILSGRHKRVVRNKRGRRPNFLLHFRFYFDPPEFQTVVVAGDKSQFHMGYFRDDPSEPPVFVCSNCPSEANSGKISACGDNLFAAVRLYAQKMISKSTGAKKSSIISLVDKLGKEAEKLGLSLEANSKSMKSRQKKVVCHSFHGAGLVVPVDSNDVGYRPVPESPGDLKKMLKKISEAETEAQRDTHEEALQELITLVQFANDEADYGEGLELGMDLFSFGGKVFHPHIGMLLPLAYQLLNRHQFSTIIQAHLNERRKDDVDELE